MESESFDDDDDVSPSEDSIEEASQESEGAESGQEESLESDGTKEEDGNAGMADVISKILGKKVPDDKPAVLSKRKIRKREAKEERPKKKRKALDHQAWEDLQHVIPDGSRSDMERELRRIATRGVVKLFNAVNKHQKELESELTKPGTTEAKRSKAISSLSQDHFLSMLRDGGGAGKEIAKEKRSSGSEPTKAKESLSTSSWAVLQDNFMTGAKLKDWDKDNSSSEGSDNANFEDSDSDNS